MKKIILSILILFILSSKSFALTRCEIFYDKIKNDYDILDLAYEAVTEINTFGFDLQVKFDKEMARIEEPGDSDYKIDDYAPVSEVLKINKKLKDNFQKPITYQNGDWAMDTNKDGYFKVGKIWTQEMSEKVKSDDIILNINGVDLRTLDLSRKQNWENIKDLNDFFKDDKELEIELIRVENNQKKFRYKIKTLWSKFEYSDPFIDFYIRSISIDEKDESSFVTIEKEYEEILSSDFPLTKLAREILYYDEEGKDPWFEECEYTVKEWTDLDTIDPNYGMVFQDLIYQDKTRYDAKYLILPSLVGTWDFITEDSLSVLYKSKGEYKFKNDFNFRTFPFDKQKIDIFIYQSRYPLGDYQASVSDWTKRELLTFQNNNDITGWNIVGNRIEYKTYKGPNDKYFLDGIQLTLDIERKSGYYIFKVIIPIILILIVCWSSIWIDPREIESRLTITIVCLLSLIAYNFVIDSEMPKLEYLTVMDHIILVSYAYATIPNFLSIVSFNLLKKRNKRKLAHQLEYFEKRYGLLSYLVIVFLIVVVSSNTNPENSSAMLSFFTGN